MTTKIVGDNDKKIFQKTIISFASPIQETMRFTAADFNLKILKSEGDVRDVAMAYALELNLLDIAMKIAFVDECDSAKVPGVPKDRNELQECILELIDACNPSTGDLKGIEFHVPLFYSFDLESATSPYFDDVLRAKAHKIWANHLSSLGIAELEVLQCYKSNRSQYAAIQPLKQILERLESEMVSESGAPSKTGLKVTAEKYFENSALHSEIAEKDNASRASFAQKYSSVVDIVGGLLGIGSTSSLVVGGIWLAFDGVWGGLGWGFVLSLFAPLVLSLALLTGMIFSYPASKLLSKGSLLFGYTLVGLSAIWTALVMTQYFAYVVAEFLPYAKRTSSTALVLWGWGVATINLRYVQQKEMQLGGQSKATFVAFSQLGFLAASTLVFYKSVTPAMGTLVAIGIISAGVLLQTFVDAHRVRKMSTIIDV